MQTLPTARIFALVAYPVLVIVSWSIHRPELRAVGFLLLVVAVAGPWMQRPAGWLFLVAMATLTVVSLAVPALALWPPGLICLAMAGWFASSLGAGRRPLIHRFARAIHDARDEPLPEGSGPWLRTWTAIWAGLLAVLGLVALGLAALDLPGLWLIWAFGAIPTGILGTLALELHLRTRRFPDYRHLSLPEFLRAVASIRPEALER